MPWTPVPPPPAPTGINQWPAAPTPTLCWQGPLPNVGIGVTDLTLTVTGVYQLVLEATVSPNISFSKTITRVKGASFTVGTEEEFSASLGVGNDFVDIGAGLSRVTTHQTTLSASITEEWLYDLTSSSGQVSIAIWQLVYTYTITGVIDLGFQKLRFTVTMVDDVDAFPQTQYPAAASVVNRAGGKMLALDQVFAPVEEAVPA